ncbi:MAG: hypothetical protein MJE68_20535 [Proteobacteria bacterium]|nr:hypothetical protein [Pseudomonadota bacterium]
MYTRYPQRPTVLSVCDAMPAPPVGVHKVSGRLSRHLGSGKVIPPKAGNGIIHSFRQIIRFSSQSA